MTGLQRLVKNLLSRSISINTIKAQKRKKKRRVEWHQSMQYKIVNKDGISMRLKKDEIKDKIYI